MIYFILILFPDRTPAKPIASIAVKCCTCKSIVGQSNNNGNGNNGNNGNGHGAGGVNS